MARCRGEKDRLLAARKGDSRESLLDAAEALFAEHGYAATSTREIVKLSGDTLGTLSYHFGGKQKLLEAILERRFAGVDECRLAYYRDMEESAQGVTLTGTIRAIVLPFLDLGLSGDEGWRSYVALLGKIRDTGNLEQREFFSTFARPYVMKCIDWLRRVAPWAPDIKLAYCYEFCMTLAIQFSGEPARRRLLGISGSKDWSFEEHRATLLDFANAGATVILGEAESG